jgi:predicted transcriptional regulator
MFEPKGARARWRIIYDLFQKADQGQVVKYTEIADALNLDWIKDRQLLQMAARRATIELERVDGRTTYAVTNEGYRVAVPTDHVHIGRSRNRRALGQIKRGEAVVTGVDLNTVDSQTRDALLTLARGFAVQGEINRRVASTQARHSRLLDMLVERVDRLEGR